jgi:rare lipoprotein A
MTLWNTLYTTLECSTLASFTLRLMRYLAFVLIIVVGILLNYGVHARLRTFSLFKNTKFSGVAANTLTASTMVQEGIGSWYGGKFHGRRTASGEIYDMNDFTAAHLTLPLGTVVRVTNTVNGKSTLVRINDRGPYIEGRIIDLSLSAAKVLNIVEPGTGDVKIEVVEGIRFTDNRFTDSVLTSDFTNSDYELAALRDASSATAFSPTNVEPLLIEQGLFRVAYKSEEFSEALKAWKKLHKKHDRVYLVPKRKTDAELARERETQPHRRVAPRLYTYEILLLQQKFSSLLVRS